MGNDFSNTIRNPVKFPFVWWFGGIIAEPRKPEKFLISPENSVDKPTSHSSVLFFNVYFIPGDVVYVFSVEEQFNSLFLQIILSADNITHVFMILSAFFSTYLKNDSNPRSPAYFLRNKKSKRGNNKVFFLRDIPQTSQNFHIEKMKNCLIYYSV